MRQSAAVPRCFGALALVVHLAAAGCSQYAAAGSCVVGSVEQAAGSAACQGAASTGDAPARRARAAQERFALDVERCDAWAQQARREDLPARVQESCRWAARMRLGGRLPPSVSAPGALEVDGERGLRLFENLCRAGIEAACGDLGDLHQALAQHAEAEESYDRPCLFSSNREYGGCAGVRQRVRERPDAHAWITVDTRRALVRAVLARAQALPADRTRERDALLRAARSLTGSDQVDVEGAAMVTQETQATGRQRYDAIAARFADPAAAARRSFHDSYALLVEVHRLLPSLSSGDADAARSFLARSIEGLVPPEADRLVAAGHHPAAVALLARAAAMADPGGSLARRRGVISAGAGAFFQRTAAQHLAARRPLTARLHAALALTYGAPPPPAAYDAAVAPLRATGVTFRSDPSQCPWASLPVSPDSGEPPGVELRVEITRCVAEEHRSAAPETVTYDVAETTTEMYDQAYQEGFVQRPGCYGTNCDRVPRMVTRRVPRTVTQTVHHVERTEVRRRTIRLELAGALVAAFEGRTTRVSFDLSLPPLAEQEYAAPGRTTHFQDTSLASRRATATAQLASLMSGGGEAVAQLRAAEFAARVEAASRAADDDARAERLLGALMVSPRARSGVVDEYFRSRYQLDRAALLAAIGAR